MKEKIKKKIKNKFLGIVEPSEDKTKSLIILIVGFTFLFMLFAITRIDYQNKPQKFETKQEINFLSLENIFNSYINYKYDIKIVDNNRIINYIGETTNNINMGKKLEDNNKLDYKIIDNKVINTLTNEEISDLYDNYLYEFFDLKKLYNYIVYLKAEEKIDNTYKIYTYKNKYNDIDINIIIKTTVDKIEEISYTYNSVNYNIRVVV